MTYIDIIESAFLSYGEESVLRYFGEVKENGIKEHGFPRLASNLAILVANGRQVRYKDLAREMMLFCCEQMTLPTIKGRGNDFSVQELVLAILALENSAVYDASVTNEMRAQLAKIQPRNCYNCIAKDEQTFPGNWAAFNACSEWMRVCTGIAKREDVIGFIDSQIATQLLAIDENFMYRDPHEPMVYDIVPRKIFAMMLYFGYDGNYRDAITEVVEKSADITLKMQSVTGELAFGGRSNQFLHNEAWLCAMFEFYAWHFAKKGEISRAGEFKSAAHLAKHSIEEWLKRVPGRHVKNRFSPSSSLIGCENYAYYDKYMITLASVCYQAHIFSDNSVEEYSCPAQNGRGITVLSDYFHKIFMHEGDYFLEFDTKADRHYDANGLGRVHKKGVPGPLCLSVPFPAECANYGLSRDAVAMSLCSFYDGEEGVKNACNAKEYKITEISDAGDSLALTLEADAESKTLFEKYTLASGGLNISALGDGKLGYNIPVFYFDGAEKTKIELSADKKTLTVSYAGHKCVYSSESEFCETGVILPNRNGEYKLFRIFGESSVHLNIVLE